MSEMEYSTPKIVTLSALQAVITMSTPDFIRLIRDPEVKKHIKGGAALGLTNNESNGLPSAIVQELIDKGTIKLPESVSDYHKQDAINAFMKTYGLRFPKEPVAPLG